MGNEKMSRRGFLKLGFAGTWGAALLLISGCLGGGGEEADDDDGGAEDA